jgi:hypothetical protein
VSVAIRIAVTTIIIWAGAFTLAAAIEPSANLIPLKQGNTWHYEGHARWTIGIDVGTKHINHLHNAEVRWTARVTRSLSAKGTTAAIISGFPLAFSIDDPEHQPGYAVVTETKKGVFVQLADSEKEGEAIAALALVGQKQGDQIFRFPIRVGDCVGDEPKAPAQEYCWLVRQRVREPQGIGWDMLFYTLPDEQSFYLVPGLGITRFSYRHHGTIIEVNVRLSSYQTKEY